MSISIWVILWIVIAVALAIIYAYRRMVEGSSDELVHLSNASDAVLARQEQTARTIEKLDRLVKILAIVFVIYGVALGGLKIYQALA